MDRLTIGTSDISRESYLVTRAVVEIDVSMGF